MKTGAGRGRSGSCLTELALTGRLEQELPFPHPHPHHTRSHTHLFPRCLEAQPLSMAKLLVSSFAYPPLVLCNCQVKEMSIHLPKWPLGSPVPRTEKMGRHPPTLSPQFSPQSPVTHALLYSLRCKQILQQFLNHCGLSHYSWTVASSGNRHTHAHTEFCTGPQLPTGGLL